ncbi:UNVERIFIED_CONTAM: hypothetical protein Sangu_2337400 [Sesamum angustifolium]|uniref:Uncharacterized protein n=1 Tax=Sesamum angustifolium TaxID=2727405 RepID=A0AAW2L780_9LAMI
MVHNPDDSNYVYVNEYRCLSRDADIILDMGRVEDTTQEVESDKDSGSGVCNEANCENEVDTVNPPIVEQESLSRGFQLKHHLPNSRNMSHIQLVD